jgi:class 3 adenylate cyclase
MTATRRLAASLAADVAGYSRLIGADEEGTLNRLRSIRAELIDPKLHEMCHRPAVSSSVSEATRAISSCLIGFKRPGASYRPPASCYVHTGHLAALYCAKDA